jgi:hypothetical protein
MFARDTAKTDAACNSRITTGDRLVWGQYLEPNVNQDAVGKLSSRAFDWCNKNMAVFV